MNDMYSLRKTGSGGHFDLKKWHGRMRSIRYEKVAC